MDNVSHLADITKNSKIVKSRNFLMGVKFVSFYMSYFREWKTLSELWTTLEHSWSFPKRTLRGSSSVLPVVEGDHLDHHLDQDDNVYHMFQQARLLGFWLRDEGRRPSETAHWWLLGLQVKLNMLKKVFLILIGWPGNYENSPSGKRANCWTSRFYIIP